MTVPPYHGFYTGVLRSLADGQEHIRADIYECAAREANLSDEDKAEMLPKGTLKYVDRASWAITYLKMAGMIESPRRSVFRITARGRDALKSGKPIDNDYLAQFKEYQEFINKPAQPKDDGKPVAEPLDSLSPDEMMNQALHDMDEVLISDLLKEITDHDPYFFERLVVDLIKAIYGGDFKNNSKVTPKSNDGGIDGVVKQDRLGFNSIYIQAKMYREGPVSRDDVQKFSGAMDGAHAVNGAFITTSVFTKGAVEFVEKLNNKHIVLIDGRELALLMMEYKIGVQTKQTIEIKKIDYDYFHPE